MTERSVNHATFTLERTYDAPPGRVFSAWADPDLKSRWFGGPNDAHELDFRVGGRETSRGDMQGSTYSFEARYYDIVPDERIVWTYEMHMDDARISVSLAAVELEPSGDGTKLTYTEHGAYLDGLDKPEMREQGTGSLLDSLGEELQRAAAR
jgi:uncharacterized protein YndB with AHSA1/START domain